MFNKTAIVLALTAVPLCAAAIAHAHSVEKGSVQVIHPWADPATTGDSRAYPTLSNEGMQPLVLTGAESPLFDHIDIIVGGMTVAQLTIPAEDVVNLDSADSHLRLVGVQSPLQEGGHFPMTLNFENHEPVAVDVVIGELTAMPTAVPADQAAVNLTHAPIAAIGWPQMTMDLPLLKSADATGLAAGDKVYFELEMGADGFYAISRIVPWDQRPAADADDAISGTGVVNGLTPQSGS